MKQRQSIKQPATTTGTSSVDQLPARSSEAEKAVVGAILLESTAIHEVYGILDRDSFYNEALGEIYDTVKTLWENGRKPDMVSVTEELARRGKLEAVGGPYGITVLASSVASTVNIREHAEYVHQSHLKRQLSQLAAQLMQRAMDQTEDIADTIQAATQGIEEIAARMEYGGGTVHISEAVKKSVENYSERERLRAEGKTFGVPTGLHILDKYLCGFQKKQLIIVGARPAMGKTALALHMAKAAALSGVPVAFFALEMDGVDLSDRLLLSAGEMDSMAFRSGWLNQEGKEAMMRAASEIENLPIYVDDCPNLSMRQIKARCVNLQRKGKCGIVFIDYLGLVDMETGSSAQYLREQKVAIASRQAKMLAKELDLPVVLLSQLNRKVEGAISQNKGNAADVCPGMADLRESGAIEQDADVVLMLHRPEYYDAKPENKGIGIINIAKQRKGKTGKIRFRYNESLTVFRDMEEEVPF